MRVLGCLVTSQRQTRNSTSDASPQLHRNKWGLVTELTQHEGFSVNQFTCCPFEDIYLLMPWWLVAAGHQQTYFLRLATGPFNNLASGLNDEKTLKRQQIITWNNFGLVYCHMYSLFNELTQCANTAYYLYLSIFFQSTVMYYPAVSTLP